ncbi:MAG: hypothetical protein R3325_02755 [Thermoanaerobaculia bacterium]|nr:hypothetical protein [Thermoanaerobaculia bacterium]
MLFAGIVGFIYSDLMVPPLVAVNAKSYGKRVALYIAGVMLVSIVATALVLHYAFAALGITPESGRAIEHVSRFATGRLGGETRLGHLLPALSRRGAEG